MLKNSFIESTPDKSQQYYENEQELTEEMIAEQDEIQNFEN